MKYAYATLLLGLAIVLAALMFDAAYARMMMSLSSFASQT